MDRVRTFTVLAVIVGMPLAVIITSQMGGMLMLVPLLLVLGIIALRFQRAGGLDAAWSGPGGIALSTSGFTEAEGSALLVPAGFPARGSVARALARVEARHLALSPWFAVGIGFWLLITSTLGVIWVEDVEWGWWEMFALLPALAHPLIGCSIVAVHRAVTRARRDRAAELFASCPATEAARTRGFLLTAWVPLLATTVFVATFLLLVAVGGSNIFGPIDRRALVDLLIVAILPVGGTALGVALGRWAPWTLTPFVAVAGVAVMSSRLSQLGSSNYETERALVSWAYTAPFDIVFLEPPVWERVAWLGGLTVVVGAVALLRSEHSRRVPIAVAFGALLAAVGAASLFRPLPEARATELASMISAPGSHQTCTAAAPEIEVCVYEPYNTYGEILVEEVAPVAAALPTGWTDEPVVFRQRFDADPEALPEAVRRLLPDDVAEVASHELYVGYSSHPEAILAGRFRLAAYALGLPTVRVETPISVAGQARGVVTAWLAVRGLEADLASDVLTPDISGQEKVTTAMRGDIWPARCYGEDAVLVWARQDLDAARALLAQPDPDVLAVVHGDWERWHDPDTTTDELLAELGLDSVGPADEIDPAAIGSCE